MAARGELALIMVDLPAPLGPITATRPSAELKAFWYHLRLCPSAALRRETSMLTLKRVGLGFKLSDAAEGREAVPVNSSRADMRQLSEERLVAGICVRHLNLPRTMTTACLSRAEKPS